jgi:hypothetical protein
MLATVLGMMWVLTAASAPLPDKVQQLLDDAEYQQARRQMDRLLRSGKISLDQRVGLYAAHAFCDVSLGDDTTAQQSFQKLLTLQPTYKADPASTSPKVLEVFELVRSRMAEQGALESAFQPDFQPLPDAVMGESVPVKVAFKGPPAGAVERVFVRYRRVGEASYESAELPKQAGTGAQFVGAIDAAVLQGGDEQDVEYYLDALGSAGERLTGVGTGNLPLQFHVATAQAFAAQDAAPVKKASGVDTLRKVAAIVVPLVLGGAAVGAVALLTVGILGLTAVEPGAAHLVWRLGRPQQP